MASGRSEDLLLLGKGRARLATHVIPSRHANAAVQNASFKLTTDKVQAAPCVAKDRRSSAIQSPTRSNPLMKDLAALDTTNLTQRAAVAFA
jgi:hypothetical protein